MNIDQLLSSMFDQSSTSQMPSALGELFGIDPNSSEETSTFESLFTGELSEPQQLMASEEAITANQLLSALLQNPTQQLVAQQPNFENELFLKADFIQQLDNATSHIPDPLVAFLSGSVEQLSTKDVLTLLVGNKFITEAVASDNTESFFETPAPLKDLIEKMELSEDVIEKSKLSSLPSETLITPKELLETVQVSSKQAVQEINTLRQYLAEGVGVAPYVEASTKSTEIYYANQPLEHGQMLVKTPTRFDSTSATIPVANVALQESDVQNTPTTANIINSLNEPTVKQVYKTNAQDPFQTLPVLQGETPQLNLRANSLESEILRNNIQQKPNNITPMNADHVTDETAMPEFAKNITSYQQTNTAANTVLNKEALIHNIAKVAPELMLEVPTSDSKESSSTEAIHDVNSVASNNHNINSDKTITLESDDTVTNNIVSKVFEKSNLMIKQGGGSIRINLDSSELGTTSGLELAVRVNGNNVEVKVLTESNEMKEKLSKHLVDLKDALSAQHLHLKDIQVSVSSNNSWEHSNSNNGTFARGEQFQESSQRDTEFGSFMSEKSDSYQEASTPTGGYTKKMSSHNGQIQVLI